MAQQTAVEFLFEQVTNLDWKNLTREKKTEILEQAKAMEKEQIINAWRNGDNDSMYSPQELDQQAEQYYNEIYMKK